MFEEATGVSLDTLVVMLKIEYNMNPNKFAAILVLVINLFYFIPETIKIILSGGGPFGLGLIALPFTILANLFSIPSILSLTKKLENRKSLQWINIVGLLICSFLLGYILSTRGY